MNFKTGDKLTYKNDGHIYIFHYYSCSNSTTIIAINSVNNNLIHDYSQCFKLHKENNMLESVKEYLKEHKSIIMTIAVVLLVDHLVFQGAFREKVKSLVDGLLNKAQKQLDDK